MNTTILSQFLQMKKLNHRKAQKYAKGHTGMKWQNQDLDQGSLAPQMWPFVVPRLLSTN